MNRPSINPISTSIKQKENTEQSNNETKENANSYMKGEAKTIVVPDLYALYLYTNRKCDHIPGTGQHNRKTFIRYVRIDPVLYDKVSKRLIKLYESKCPDLKKMNGKFSLEPFCFTYTWFKYIEPECQISNI